MFPVAGKRRLGSNHYVVRNFERGDNEVIGHECRVNVCSIFQNCKRAVGGCVTNTSADARPAASKEEEPLSIEGVLSSKFAASDSVNLQLAHTTVRDAPQELFDATRADLGIERP